MRRPLAVLALAGLLPSAAVAEPGVTDKEILIGVCTTVVGPNQAVGHQQMEGAKAYIEYINQEKNGVEGRTINLLVDDDGHDPDQAISCLNAHLKAGVLASAFVSGSPPAAKQVTMAEAARMPLVGFNSGAPFIFEPFHRYSFASRSPFADEAESLVEHLWNDLGIRKIGVIYQSDAFGGNALQGIKAALKKRGGEPAGLGSFPRGSLEVKEAVSLVRSAEPEAVILAANYAPEAEVFKLSKSLGWKPQFVILSGRDNVIQASSGAAEGLVISMVYPLPTDMQVPAVALYNRLLKRYSPGAKPSFVSIEGFIEAMILVEGLQRAGRDLTREKLVDALESFRDVDLGLGPEFKISYGKDRRFPFQKYIATVVRDGKSVLLKDWKKLKR